MVFLVSIFTSFRFFSLCCPFLPLPPRPPPLFYLPSPWTLASVRWPTGLTKIALKGNVSTATEIRWHQQSWERGMKTPTYPTPFQLQSFVAVTDKENCNFGQYHSRRPLSSPCPIKTPILLQLRKLPDFEGLPDTHQLNIWGTVTSIWITNNFVFLDRI